ncbi:hypothetical protein FGY73_17650 [Shigella flexneri]|nr:hypothetical protein [Shigella flexneri]
MFCSTWIWSAPPPKPDIPTRRPDAPGGASGKTNRTKAGNSKITHSGDSQPPAMREKSTMFLWNK